MIKVRELSKEALTDYAESHLGNLQKILAAEPGRLDHRDVLIETTERRMEELRPAAEEYRGFPELLNKPEQGKWMRAVIRDFEILEEILRRARLAEKERG